MKEINEVAQIFFIPTGLFLTALAASRTEPLKTTVSLLGLVVSVGWLYSTLDAPAPSTNLDETLAVCPVVFAFAWFCSMITHLCLWFQERCCVAKRIERMESRIALLKSRKYGNAEQDEDAKGDNAPS